MLHLSGQEQGHMMCRNTKRLTVNRIQHRITEVYIIFLYRFVTRNQLRLYYQSLVLYQVCIMASCFVTIVTLHALYCIQLL
jgi:hypothetical protein